MVLIYLDDLVPAVMSIRASDLTMNCTLVNNVFTNLRCISYELITPGRVPYCFANELKKLRPMNTTLTHLT